MAILETAVVQRPVPMHIEDLVRFAQFLETRKQIAPLPSEKDLVALARIFWDAAHGEE